MKDDFRVGDRATLVSILQITIGSKEIKKYETTIHGHLDLEDIQRYIESKEHKPVRKVKKYINIWNRPGKGLVCSGNPYETEEDAKKAAGQSNKYVLVALPIEVTE